MGQREMIDQEQQTLPPAVLAELRGTLDRHMTLLAGIYHETKKQPRPFDVDVRPSDFCTPRDIAGVVRWIHNPSNVPLTLTLCVGSDSAPPRFNRQLAPGESLPVFLRFASGLFCVAGAGAVLGGEYDE